MKRIISAAVLFASAIVSLPSSFATTIDFSTPSGGSLSVIGGLDLYGIFDAKVTQPSGSNTQYTVTIETNYPGTIPAIPPATSIPQIPYNGSGMSFGIGDFLFTWMNQDYAIVLSPHDGLLAGDLYQSDGFITSGQLMAGLSPGRSQSLPVWLAATNALLDGTGTLTVMPTGKDGSSAANFEYLITDTFSAPANFLASGDFTISMTSYACANGIIQGTGNFGGTGPSGGVPEPRTMLLVLPALLALAAVKRFFR